jgi:hypothetical protein
VWFSSCTSDLFVAALYETGTVELSVCRRCQCETLTPGEVKCAAVTPLGYSKCTYDCSDSVPSVAPFYKHDRPLELNFEGAQPVLNHEVSYEMGWSARE